ncbi:flavin reductase family protein [Phenylobacterium sp.]|uniref:flavin reductase family protein n=1 Tax=Phenylobacterium sp. TaxID=1871053 RepID=UPI00301D2E74
MTGMSAHTDADLLTPAPLADEVTFRNGLAKLASGVAIVACWAEGRPRGLLVSSLTGLSTQPPRLLFCVRKAAGAHDALLRAEAVSVSLLDEADRIEAERFATSARADERFNRSGWRLDGGGAPERLGSLAVFAGPVRSRIDGGTHTIFILDVNRAHARSGDPLLYFERDFRKLA